MTRYLPPEPSGAAPGGPAMYCFPSAGGGAAAYSSWQRRLGPGVRVVPVRLPGRESRIAEPRFTDIGALVAELDDQLGPELERGPHLLFGHSMGAVIAYTLAHRRVRSGKRPPRALLLSAYRPTHLDAPSLFEDVAALHASGAPGVGDALAEILASIGGIPRALLRHTGWRSLLLPIVRDDLLLCGTVAQRPPEPIPVPLHLFAGSDDALASPGEMAQWSLHSAAESDLTVFTGGHFYLRDRAPEFLAHLSALLARYTGGPAGSGAPLETDRPQAGLARTAVHR